MKILVPVDGSKQSEQALEYAVKTFSSLGTKYDDDHMNNTMNSKTGLMRLHVLPQFTVPLGFERPMRSLKTGEVVSFSEYINEMNDSLIHQWENKLSDYRKKCESKYESVQTRLITQTGSIAGTIIDVAEKEKINLIVVGNIGLGGISKLKTLGSVSRSVSEMAKCPVLIVH